MRMNEFIHSLRVRWLLWQIESVQRNIDLTHRECDEKHGALRVLNADLMNLKSKLSIHAIRTERRTNMLKRVLFGWLERVKRS